MRVYGARKRYQPTAAFRTWLFTIVTRLCLNEIRSIRRERRILAPPGDLLQEGVIPEGPGAENPEARPYEKEAARAVQAAIRSLPESQRTAVLLARYEEMSYRDISKVLECSVAAVKSLLSRARRNLKERLRPYVESGRLVSGMSEDLRQPGREP